MNASELTQRRRLEVLERARRSAPSNARTTTHELRMEELALEYPCLPAEICAPVIDFSSINVTYPSGVPNPTITYSLSWSCVPGATHYRVFTRTGFNAYINTTQPSLYAPQVTESNASMFTSMSDLITGTSYTGTFQFVGSIKLQMYVFAYRNGKRGALPCTYAYYEAAYDLDTITNIKVELWPTVTRQFTGATNGAGYVNGEAVFDTVTVTNRNTCISKTFTRETYVDNMPITGETNPDAVVGAGALASVNFPPT